MRSYKIEDIEKGGLEALRSNPELRAFFFQEYSIIFEEPCKDCPGKLAGYFEKFIKNNTMTNSSEPRYKLKNTVIDVQGIGFVNQKSFTDEKAIHMLSISSGYLKMLEAYPSDWEKDVAKYRKAKAKAKPAAQEAPAQAPESTEEAPEPTQEGNPYRDKLIALKGIAEKTADQIIEAFPHEAALQAHILAGKDLEFPPQANKALLKEFGE